MKPEIHKDEGYRFMAAAFEVYNDPGREQTAKNSPDRTGLAYISED